MCRLFARTIALKTIESQLTIMPKNLPKSGAASSSSFLDGKGPGGFTTVEMGDIAWIRLQIFCVG